MKNKIFVCILLLVVSVSLSNLYGDPTNKNIGIILTLLEKHPEAFGIEITEVTLREAPLVDVPLHDEPPTSKKYFLPSFLFGRSKKSSIVGRDASDGLDTGFLNKLITDCSPRTAKQERRQLAALVETLHRKYGKAKFKESKISTYEIIIAELFRRSIKLKTDNIARIIGAFIVLHFINELESFLKRNDLAEIIRSHKNPSVKKLFLGQLGPAESKSKPTTTLRLALPKKKEIKKRAHRPPTPFTLPRETSPSSSPSPFSDTPSPRELRFQRMNADSSAPSSRRGSGTLFDLLDSLSTKGISIDLPRPPSGSLHSREL